MGCCMSNPKPPPQKHHHHNNQHFSSNGRERAPPSMEEETIVKEVLSETPIPKPKPKPKPPLAIAKPDPQKLTTTTSSLVATPKPDEIQKKKFKPLEEAEISEVSEICSVSECVSTTTVAESRDGDGEVKQRVLLLDVSPAAKFPRYRSYSGDTTGNRTRGVNGSPARRSDPSPAKRNDVSVRSGNQQQTRRRMVTSNARRDPGESSGRRSRSPATRPTETAAGRSVMGRSQSTGKTGQSPGRVKKNNNNADFEYGNGNNNNKWANTPNESLENPLVSLECFIFL